MLCVVLLALVHLVPVACGFDGVALSFAQARLLHGRSQAHARSPLPPSTVVPVTTPPLAVQGDPGELEGIFDPSTRFASDGRLYMSYSVVPAQNLLHQRMAVAAGAGGAWQYVTALNAPFNATLPGTGCPGGSCTGTVVHEVSSLVEDVGDPDPDRRWKLFTHTYLVGVDGTFHYDIGHISLFTAPAPDTPGLWLREPWLGWVGESNFSVAGVKQVLTDLPPLADCVAFTEPGAATSSGVLLLALGCVYIGDGGVPSIRIELLLSSNHGGAFSWVRTALAPGDLAPLGFNVTQVNAADLVDGVSTSAHGVNTSTVLLVATPVIDGAYAGCLVFPLDATHGTGPVLRYLVPSASVFSGACTASATAATGGLPGGSWLLPAILIPDAPRVFTVLPTGIAPP